MTKRAGRLLTVAVTVAVLCAATIATRRVSAAAPRAGTVISGTVGGSDQGPLTGASVVIDGPLHRDTHTDADGRFTFTDVSRGRYHLVVKADGYLPLEQNMDVGDASVSVDIVLLHLPGLA